MIKALNGTLYTYMDKQSRNPNGRLPIDLTGQRFHRLVVSHRVPSPNPKRIMWECVCDCGTTRHITTGALRSGNTKSCGCYHRDVMSQLSGPNAPNWNGGRTKDTKGYVRILAPADWTGPVYATGRKRQSRYVLEHVYVMSKHLGRLLLSHENVHHKNGVRDDNRIENLELWTSTQPSGQRVVDVVKWCREFLSRYDEKTLQAISGE